MDLRQIEYFVRVAELGSFSKAALVLSMAQPALSRQVRLLEQELGQELLLRNGRGVTLTDAGTLFLKHGHGILHQVQRARDELRAARARKAARSSSACRRVSAAALTAPLVGAFKARFPKPSWRLVEGLSAHLAEWLQVGRIDLALLLNPDPRPEIDIAPVFEEPLYLVSPAPCGIGAGAGRRWSDTAASRRWADYPLVIPDRLHAIRRLVETRAAHLGLKLKIAMEVASAGGMLDLVKLGFGHAMLPISALAQRGVATDYLARQIVEPRLPVLVTTAVSAVRPLSPLVTATRGLVSEQLLRVADDWIGRSGRRSGRE